MADKQQGHISVRIAVLVAGLFAVGWTAYHGDWDGSTMNRVLTTLSVVLIGGLTFMAFRSSRANSSYAPGTMMVLFAGLSLLLMNLWEVSSAVLLTVALLWTWFTHLSVHSPPLLWYIVRRVLIFIPTFLTIALLAFYISQESPVDPVERLVSNFDAKGGAQQGNAASIEEKDRIRKRMGLNKPTFYFTMSTMAFDEELYSIKDKNHRENLDHLISKYGNWTYILNYYRQLEKGYNQILQLSVDDVFERHSHFKDSTVNVTDTGFYHIGNADIGYKPVGHPSFERLVEVYPDHSYMLFNFSRVDSIPELKDLEEDSLYAIGAFTEDSSGMVYTDSEGFVHRIGDVVHLQVTTVQGYRYLSDSTREYVYTKDEINEAKSLISNCYVLLMETAAHPVILGKLDTVEGLVERYAFLSADEVAFQDVTSAYAAMRAHETRWKNFIPSFSWNGAGNQFHIWLFGQQSWFGDADEDLSAGILRGDFGHSYSTKQEVTTDLWKKFKISFELVLFAVILAYLVSIPIGIYSAYRKDSLFDRGSAVVLFILYSVPNFFVGLLLLQFFANPDQFEWFEATGYKSPELTESEYYAMSYQDRLAHSWPYMVLPLITYCYAMFAFLSRVMRVGMLETLQQDYIRTARAKGLPERVVILKHALRNSLLPIITVFANIFPLAVGGSVIIEMIFDYEGMGKATLDAVLTGDYPMMIGVFCLAGILTMIGYLVADVLYAVVDPRISYSKRR